MKDPEGWQLGPSINCVPCSGRSEYTFPQLNCREWWCKVTLSQQLKKCVWRKTSSPPRLLVINVYYCFAWLYTSRNAVSNCTYPLANWLTSSILFMMIIQLSTIYKTICLCSYKISLLSEVFSLLNNATMNSHVYIFL